MVERLTFGGNFIDWYWIFILIALIVGVPIFYLRIRDNKKIGLSIVEIAIISNIFLFVGYLSAIFFTQFTRVVFTHLGLIVSNQDYTLSSTKLSVFEWDGALFFFVILEIALFFSLRRQRNRILELFDQLVIALCIMYAIGKMGCFFSGHLGCRGVITALPWGVFYSKGNYPSMYPLHPVQIYDSLFSCALFVFLKTRDKEKKHSGTTTVWYLTLFSFFNLFMEGLRDTPKEIGVYALGQYLYGTIIALALFFLYFIKKQKPC